MKKNTDHTDLRNEMKKCKDWQADLSLEDLLICNFSLFCLLMHLYVLRKKRKKILIIQIWKWNEDVQRLAGRPNCFVHLDLYENSKINVH